MKEAKVLFSNNVLLENESIMQLDYCLTERYSEDDHQKPYYGVRVEKRLDGQVDADEVAGISFSREKVVTILEKLCKHEVTPISLTEIIDDMQTMEDMAYRGEMLTQGV